MNGRNKIEHGQRSLKHSFSLLSLLVLAAAAVLMAACKNPTGVDPSDNSYEDDLASFVQAVEELSTPPADADAAEVFTYAITVDTLADVYGILEADVIDAVTDQIADEELRAKILGVLDGSVTLMDLMVADTGMYQDTEQQIVVGLPLQEEIPADSPIETHGTLEIVDDDERVGMDFDDAEDYLIIPADPTNDLTQAGTIEAWLKPDVNVNWAGIIHKGTEPDWSDEGYSLQYDGNQRLLLAMTSEAGQLVLVHTLHVLSTGTWSYVVATWDEDEVHIYVDGVDVVDSITLGFSSTETTIAENYPFKSSDGDIVVGTQIPGDSYRFDGVMSGIKIYDRYMEQSEVLDNFGE
jgi:hypothetical protein